MPPAAPKPGVADKRLRFGRGVGEHLGEVGQAGVEDGNGRGIGALLRTEDRGSSTGAGERIVDVDGDAPADLKGTRIQR